MGPILSSSVSKAGANKGLFHIQEVSKATFFWGQGPSLALTSRPSWKQHLSLPSPTDAVNNGVITTSKAEIEVLFRNNDNNSLNKTMELGYYYGLTSSAQSSQSYPPPQGFLVHAPIADKLEGVH